MRSIHIKTTSLLAALGLMAFSFYTQSVEAGKRVLMVVSSYGINQGEDQPGYEHDELAKAYLTFRDNGVAIYIASPKGGAVEADKYDPNKSYNAEFLKDKQAVAKIGNTLKLIDANPNHYDGIFVVGGKGAMFDFPNSKPLQNSIAKVYEAGGTIGAVCHGPAALVNVKLSNGQYLVSNKKVNAFTNQEEAIFGKKWVKHFEFLLEDKLQERNAHFESSPMMLSHVAVDDRLITGQNPTATTDAAKAMLKSMGIKPKAGNEYSDDLTLKLVAKILKGDKAAEAAYKNNTKNYEPSMLGMYGYYHFLNAQSNDQVKQAVTLMTLAQKDMNHPQLGLQIAKAYQQLGEVAQSKQVLNDLVAQFPEFADAKQMLGNL